jgi:Mg-chelatase subunit ChlD
VAFSFRREGRTYRAGPPMEVVAGDRIVVEVLNGCGAWGAASHVAEKLRMHGFDVVRVGNARDFDYPVTVVIDRSGSMEKARALARLMGCESIVQQVAPDAYLDVTVVLGTDGVWRRGRLFPREEDP